LDEPRHRLARIALAAREPADEIERVRRLELEDDEAFGYIRRQT
jgi:hypothetical protein